MIEIDSKTTIDYGLIMSPHFKIEHLTSGAHNPYIGKFTPIFHSDFDFMDKSHDAKKLIPKWQIAYNLSRLSQEVIERLYSTFGASLMITNVYGSYSRTNTVSDESSHLIGSAVDFTVDHSSNDMFYEAVRAYFAVKHLIDDKVCSFRLVYGETSWVHIGMKAKYTTGNIGEKDYGVSTVDLVSGFTIDGIEPIRGLPGESWLEDLQPEI